MTDNNNGWPRQESRVLDALERLEAGQREIAGKVTKLEVCFARLDERVTARAGLVAGGVTLLGIIGAVLLQLL